MTRNRIRDLSTIELLVQVVNELIETQLHPFPTEATSRRAERLYRELSRRSDASSSHSAECVCIDCIDYFDEVLPLSQLLSEDPLA